MERSRSDRGHSEADIRRGDRDRDRDRDREIRRRDDRGGGGPQLQLMEQEHDGGGSTWLVIQPERSKSQVIDRRGDRRRAPSEDDSSSLSISIGPDNTVSVDSGRRRRIMG